MNEALLALSSFMLVKWPGQRFPESRNKWIKPPLSTRNTYIKTFLCIYQVPSSNGGHRLPARLSLCLSRLADLTHRGKKQVPEFGVCQMFQENSIFLQVANVYPSIWPGTGLFSGAPDFDLCLIMDRFSVTTQYSVSVSFPFCLVL